VFLNNIIFRDPTLCRFDSVPACGRRTDRRTDSS